MKKIIKLIVKEKNLARRLDSFISLQIADISRTRIKNLILDGFVKVNNNTNYNPSDKIDVNDNIYIQIPNPVKTNIKPYNYKLDIIFEDNCFRSFHLFQIIMSS